MFNLRGQPAKSGGTRVAGASVAMTTRAWWLPPLHRSAPLRSPRFIDPAPPPAPPNQITGVRVRAAAACLPTQSALYAVIVF